MEGKMQKQNVDRLDIPCSTKLTLKENKITTIGHLCRKTRVDLKSINLTNNEINKIDIELQLIGLNLKGTL